ncbi:putative 18S rRNA biogenesis protein [Paratrimastix pyriformis]|uniref:18S rRNA biogenesis protein n=1 Tax=Paratrimastix pyriformis TaxID=342808 RepID=A0ABQ8UEM5_9EUKA|nr:putative 18S rRNA biogenesis protein [Paratrimastix pyriformis]
MLSFEGCVSFRQRIVYSTLTQRPVRIRDIRSLDAHPGLRDYETNFLQLMEKFTNGCQIQINTTGTVLTYRPGVIDGGSFEHQCNNARGIGYYLEALLVLAPFGKKPFRGKLLGITAPTGGLQGNEPSVDAIRVSALPVLKQFGIIADLDIKIKKRGCPPEGGGEVEFWCPAMRTLRPINLNDPGFIKRVRGVLYSSRLSPHIANSAVSGARGVLNTLLPDVYINTLCQQGAAAGASPGYGLCLWGESTTGCIIAADVRGEAGRSPEDVGIDGARLLLEEIRGAGCVDSVTQWVALTLMALTPVGDASVIRTGPLSEHTIRSLRLLRDFFGVVFRVQPDQESGAVRLSCVGMGFQNLAKKDALYTTCPQKPGRDLYLPLWASDQFLRHPQTHKEHHNGGLRVILLPVREKDFIPEPKKIRPFSCPASVSCLANEDILDAIFSPFSNRERIELGRVCRVWARASHLLCNLSVSPTETAGSLGMLFQRYPHLHHVILNCRFDTPEPTTVLCDFLRSDRCGLDSLSLPWAGGPELTRVFQALAEQTTSRPVQSLDLSCPPGAKNLDGEVRGLDVFLRTTKSLRFLDLTNRHLYRSWDGVFDGLCACTSLEELVLISTRISSDHSKDPLFPLARLFAENRTLRTLRLGESIASVQVMGPELAANQTLRCLELNSNRVDEAQLAALLQQNQGLEQLKIRFQHPFSYSTDPEPQPSSALAAMGLNHTIRTLVLSPMGSKAPVGDALAEMLTVNQTLRRLTLGGGSYTPENLVGVWQAIGAHPTLEMLALKSATGAPWDEAVPAIGAALRRTRSLRHLKISGFPAPRTPAGCHDLLTALLGPSSLHSLTLRRVSLAKWDGIAPPNSTLDTLRLGSNGLTPQAVQRLADWVAVGHLTRFELPNQSGTGQAAGRVLWAGVSRMSRLRRVDVSGCGVSPRDLAAWVKHLQEWQPGSLSSVRVGPLMDLTLHQTALLVRCAGDEGVQLDLH